MSRRVPRVHHAEGGLATDVRIRLSRQESHHAARVLRLRAGDALRVFDGLGHEFDAQIVDADPESMEVRIDSEVCDAVEAELVVRLYQGTCKPERMAWAVQKATEIGVASIHLLQTERVETRLARRGQERLSRVALEATKQAGRRCVPRVSAAESLPDAAPAVLALLLDPSRTSPALAECVARDTPSEVWLAVGPEGGFTGDEVAAAASQGWIPASMGPRVLRSETAGIVAAALILHVWGDLGRG